MNPSQLFARDFLGERRGRSVSRIIGTGIARTFGGDAVLCTHVAHGLMVAAAAKEEARTPILVGLGIAFFIGY